MSSLCGQGPHTVQVPRSRMFLSVGFPVPSPQICSHVPVLLVTWVPPTWPAAAHSWRQAQDTIQFSHHTGERLLCGKCADLVCAHLVSVGGVTCVCLARIPWQWPCSQTLHWSLRSAMSCCLFWRRSLRLMGVSHSLSSKPVVSVPCGFGFFGLVREVDIE